MSTIRKCEDCGCCWPAMTTVEAYNNRRRMKTFHAGTQCHDKDGDFGPPNPKAEKLR